MEFVTEHWLSVGVGVFLLSMILYGHYRGFLRIALSLSALVISILVVRIAMPHVTGFLNENTQLQQTVGQAMLQMAGIDRSELEGVFELPEIVMPSQQREVIENLHLPEQMKEALLENNNSEIYQLLNVDAFFDYVGTYLANMIVNLVGSVILFLLIYIGLRLVIKWADLIARLPILNGMNQIAGAVLGGIQGLLIVWFLCLILRVCADSHWTAEVLAQVNGSVWLRFLYENNIFNWLFVRILNSFVS